MDLQKCFVQGAPIWVPLALRLTGRRGLQGCVPLTLPLATAVASADALEQVPPIVLLAPGIPNSIGCPSVLIDQSTSDWKLCQRVRELRGVRHEQERVTDNFKISHVSYFDFSPRKHRALCPCYTNVVHLFTGSIGITRNYLENANYLVS